MQFATYMWVAFVVLNGLLRVAMELIGMSCDCDDSPCLKCLKGMFVGVWLLTPLVYFLSSTMLVCDSDYLETQKGGLLWPLAMVAATIGQASLTDLRTLCALHLF